jgi:Cell wall-active antibiotics response LiaF, C-terminal
MPPPPRPAPVKTHSPLGRLVLSLAMFAVGLVVLIDVAGARVPVSVYFGVPLAVVAAGLIVAAWYGRARGLIGAGVVLSLLLAVTATAEGAGWTSTHQSVTWQPAGIEQVQSTYQVDAGNAVLDLSRVNFTGHTTSLTVHVSVGNLDIILPSTVDVDLRATVAIGDATVLGQHWSGIGQTQHTVTDNGADGPGGGQLTIDATVNVGNLEVRR